MVEITTLSEVTIDGKLSLGPSASSKDLFLYSTDELKAWFHAQRAASDAIMVGANTVRTDDPELTVRYVAGRNPLRVIPSSDGLLPPAARLLNDGVPTLIAVSKKATPAAIAALKAIDHVEVVVCGERQIDLPRLMRVLAVRGIERLIVEGGSELLTSLFQADLVSRIIIKHIPVIAGSPDAPTYLNGSVVALSRWRLDEWFIKGGIGVSIYRPAGEAPS
jgi:5-amino-6-(5-phosphoribosylamino)uracil reductase/2,5-diamino-6-(ribosylamino)-4(3H)-pyrimidinone 5'-phosphate reductase